MATKPSKTTHYVVLRATGESQFQRVGETDAGSADKAIDQVAGTLSSPEGNYVAVPARSFQVVPVVLKVQPPKLIIGSTETKSPETDRVADAARKMRDELDPVTPPVAAAVSQ